MAGDNDDDEFWANEDFIATIENVVKKAEEASAARHGTQTFGTPTSLPPQSINSRAADVPGMGSRFETHAHGSFDFRLTDGSSGACEGFPSNAGHAPAGERSKVDVKGGIYRAPLQRGQFPLPSVNYHKSLLVEEWKDVHSNQPQEWSNPNFLWDVQPPSAEEGSESFLELLAEKDGAISLLRSRLKQAEQQLDQLRKRGTPQSVSHPPLHQQRELERLSSQLMFKDHEISEAQRAHIEKEKQLKDALAETAILKEELERLKKARQTGAELQQPREEESMDVADKNAGLSAIGSALPHTSVKSILRVPRQRHDPWSPPWVPEGTLQGMEGKRSAGQHGYIPKDCPVTDGVSRLQDDSPVIEALKTRTVGNGCVTSEGKEGLDNSHLPEIELHKRETSGVPGNSSKADQDRSSISEGLSMCSRISEISYSLQQLWGLKGVRNDGVSLLAKVYASCRQELYTLLSSGESQGISRVKSSDTLKKRKTENWTISEKLHTALAKVTNGFAQPEIIITPLLEFCQLDNAILVGSSLHVLRCVLHNDSTCRKKLLLRGRKSSADHVQFSGSSENFQIKEKTGEGKGWFMTSSPTESSTTHMSPVFCSPRILCHPLAGKDPVQNISSKRDVIEKGVTEAGNELRGPCVLLQQTVLKQKEVMQGGHNEATGVSVEDLNLLVKWMLHLALTSSSPTVKFEAVAIIGVLIVHSEPLQERAMFGPLLCCGGIELLLKDSAGAEIQLQAVRMIHLLLHCPTLFQRFCAVADGMTLEPNSTKDAHNTMHSLDKQTAGHNDRVSENQALETSKTTITRVPSGSTNLDLSLVKLLEGMAECLKNTGSNLQRYVLHRSVIRLLAFITDSGDSGAASLMLAGTSYEDTELRQTNKDAKMEGIIGGESASGQPTVKRLDGGDRLNGLPLGLVNESVDDLEKVQNIPQRLVTLIDSELDIYEREGITEGSLAEERDCLIREAVTLLCQLSSHAVQSPVVIGYLISNKDMARLTISVTNRLIRRNPFPQLLGTGQKPAAPRNSETAELARALRRRVLSSLEES